MKLLHTSLVLSALFFCVFFFNVVLGAFFKASFLSDVGEALTLFVSVLFSSLRYCALRNPPLLTNYTQTSKELVTMTDNNENKVSRTS